MTKTPLIHRDREIAEIISMLRDGEVRLVTLVGAPGIGKTRVAIAVAERMSSEPGVEVVFVDLTTVRDPDHVAILTGQALGIRYVSQRRVPTEEAIARVVRDRRVLVVLDNFEHVIAAAPFTAAVLERCPGVQFMLTSRAGLGLTIEHQVAIPPLEVPNLQRLPALQSFREIASVALFRLNARVVDSQWEITSANSNDVAVICNRLDGLPLAIELASAWMRVLTPRELVAELSRTLDLLVANAPDRPARHHTLRAAIRWSYDLLTPEQRRRFRQLAVFVGGFTVEACIALWGDDKSGEAEALHHLAALHDRHLVYRQENVGESARFGLLETIRAFAREELLANGEEEETRNRHALLFTELCEEAERSYNSPAQAKWLEQLEYERGNLRAALDWCVEGDRPPLAQMGLRIGGALWFFWDVRGHVQEGRAPLKDLLALPSTQAHTLERTRALLTAAWLAYVQGDAEEVVRLTDQCVALSTELGDRLGLARALAIEGTSGSLYSADLAHVSDVLEQALVLGRELADTWTIGFSTFSIGLVDIRQGHLDASWKNSEECRRVSALAGNTWGQACALYRLSVLRVHAGQVEDAIRLQQDSLRMNWDLRNLRVIGLNLVVLGCCSTGAAAASDRVRLLAAAEVLFDAAGYSLPPSLNGIYEPAVGQLRVALGDRFDEAWKQGRNMSVDDAVTLGLSIGHHQHGSHLGLSDREEQVAALVAEGLRDREIADRLGISRRTVDNHLRNIFTKANVSTRSGLASWFIRAKGETGTSQS